VSAVKQAEQNTDLAPMGPAMERIDDLSPQELGGVELIKTQGGLTVVVPCERVTSIDETSMGVSAVYVQHGPATQKFNVKGRPRELWAKVWSARNHFQAMVMMQAASDMPAERLIDRTATIALELVKQNMDQLLDKPVSKLVSKNLRAIAEGVPAEGGVEAPPAGKKRK